MKHILRILAGLLLLGLIGLGGALGFIYSGLYDISATDQHTPPVYWAMQKAMRQSVRQRGDVVKVPDLSDPVRIDSGLARYHEHCLQCHGAPGIARERAAMGMTPVPANLVHTAREWTPGEIFWVIKNGIKMTGMPAWQFRMSDEEIWNVVAFVQRLPALSPREYAALIKAQAARAASAPVPGEDGVPLPPDPDRGKTAIRHYSCHACHEIPGITGANVPVGPPLKGIASRKYLAGILPNSPENMMRWIRAPQEVAPLSAMPDLHVSERDARDITAYLLTLED